MHRRIHIAFLPPLVVLLWLASCSFSIPKVSLTVQWAPPTEALSLRASPSTVNDVSCFFINITGTGLTANYGPSDYGGRTPDCLGTGVVAGPYPLDSLQKGVKLSLLPGANRKIEILGAISAPLGNNCLAYPLPEYFGTTAAPQLYELGSTTQNIFVDSRIDVQDSYDLNTATDRVATCASSVVGNTETAEIVPKSIVVYALFSTVPELKLFYYDPEGGTFRLWKEFTVNGGSIVQRLNLSDDFTRLFVPLTMASSGAAVYTVSGTRDLTRVADYAPTGGQGWTHTAVSQDGKNLYGFGVSSIYTALHAGVTTTAIFPSYFASGVHSPVVTNSRVFGIENSNPGRLFVAQRAPTTGLLTTSSSNALADLNSYANARVHVSLNFNSMMVTDPPKIYHYTLSDTLVFATDNIDFGNGVIEGALSRNGSRFYVNATMVTGGRISSVLSAVKLVGNGNLDLVGPILNVGGVGKLYLDPTEKHLFIRTNTSTLVKVGVTVTLGAPAYTAPTNVTDLDGSPVSSLVDLAFVPVYQ